MNSGWKTSYPLKLNKDFSSKLLGSYFDGRGSQRPKRFDKSKREEEDIRLTVNKVNSNKFSLKKKK